MRNQHNVREHTRIRNGKQETVRHHTRGRNSGNSDNKVTYRPTKLFNILAGGVCLYFCAAFGWSFITSTYSKVKEAKEKVEQVQEVAEYINTAKQGKTGEYKFDIKKEISIDEEDVADIIEKISEYIDTGNKLSEDVIIVDQSAVTDLKSYEKKIIKKISRYKDSVTVVILISDIQSNADSDTEYERVKALASDNMDLLVDTDFHNISICGTYNCPKSDDMMICLTYLGK